MNNKADKLSETTKEYSNSNITYKSKTIFELVPAATLDLHFFKKIYLDLSSSTEELAEMDITKLQIQPNQSQEEFDNLKNYTKSLFKVTIHIYGSRGEYILTEDVSIFDSPELPDVINKIVFENSSKFKVALNKNIGNQFQIAFDFTTPKIFNFNISPSLGTPINSTIDINGENGTWVSGVYQKVITPLEERKNKHGWLHGNNIYDIFIWLLILPFTFRLLYISQQIFQNIFSSMSGFLKGAFYVYVAFLILSIFRIIFSYARWVFPYLELDAPRRKTMKHRYFLGAILLSVISGVVYDLIKLIF